MPLQVQECLAGRLAHFQKNWALIIRDRWVLDTVKGYHIEFHTTPHQTWRPQPPQMSQSWEDIMQTELQKLIAKQAVTEVTMQVEGVFHSTLFLVPKKDGGQRPVINLKPLNCFVQTHHFKMEGMHDLKNLLREGDWLVKVDLKDAFFSVLIHLEHRKYLSFTVGNTSYQFTCLPFGLASAPWVFTKTLRPVTALGRELGMRMIAYIDDILLLAKSEEKARDQAEGLVYLLQCLGFTINQEKTILEPSQNMEFLGFTVDTRRMELSLPAEKLKKIWAESRKLMAAEQVTGRTLSRLIGKMNAANQVTHQRLFSTGLCKWNYQQP